MPKRSLVTRWRWIGCGVAVTALAVLSAGSVLAASAAGPANTTAPSVSGSPITGKLLTGSRGTWTGTNIKYTYAWLRCDTNGANCAAIAGATGTTYTITSAVLGATIRFAVTASDSSGETTLASSPTGEITTGNGKPASSSPPTLTGTATVGTTLASTTGSWVGDQPITYSYQWLQCDQSGNACAPISAAVNSSYKLAQDQVGSTVRIKVIATNSRGNGSAISTQSAVVQDASGGGGIINLPNGGKSVDVVDIPAGERLIVQKVQFSPNPVRSRSSSITITVTVKDTRGYYVRNAFVYLRSTPILTSTPTDAQTANDGRIKYAVKPRSDFPLKNGYSVQFFVKAYRKGDPTLAGIAGTRLVQVATASS
jgi:hypothetical protein